jgi:hypothetical protein
MTSEALVALRRARGSSQRDAALAWGIAVNTIWRWEHDQRQIPLWIEKMFEREHPLLKKIEVLEKQVASLSSQIPHPGLARSAGPWLRSVGVGGRAQPAEAAVRCAPEIREGEESFAVLGVAIEDFLRDAKLRGAARTEENRREIGTALANRELARCGLCHAPASAVGMFTLSRRTPRGRMRAVFYGLCSACGRWPDYDASIEARIRNPRFGHWVELAAGEQAFPTVFERSEWLNQFSGSTQEFLRERVTHPERFGLDRCSLCRSRPLAVFGALNLWIGDADEMWVLYSLCHRCWRGDGHGRMKAKIRSRIAARDHEELNRNQ